MKKIMAQTGKELGQFATRIVNALNKNVRVVNRAHTHAVTAGVRPRISLLYNPDLKNSWFIVTGMIGVLLVMLGIAVSSSAMVKEKEMGTVEQLLMTPADGAEIIAAKIAPIFLLLSLDIGISIAVGRLRV
jgi:ABC-2 type transport system permease protein